MHPRLRQSIVIAIGLAACARSEIVPGVRDSTFVAAMSDLRRAEGSMADTAALANARRKILQQRGLTVEQLEQAARALADDPSRAVRLWQAIDARAVNLPATNPPTR